MGADSVTSVDVSVGARAPQIDGPDASAHPYRRGLRASGLVDSRR